MLEQQRIEYLQAMGIQLWIPRQALDNAAESSWLADASVTNTSSESAQGSANIQAGHAADLLAGIDMVDAKPILQTKAPIAAETSTSTIVQQNSNLVEPINQVVATTELEGIAPVVTDLTVPNFELYFALWPCGILWVASQSFDREDHAFQTAVSYSLLGNAVPQANYSQFKWPYIEGSAEDQSMAVALRALTAQWEFMGGQGARAWVAMDDSSLDWLARVASKPVFSIPGRAELYCVEGKKQLWHALQNLSMTTGS